MKNIKNLKKLVKSPDKGIYKINLTENNISEYDVVLKSIKEDKTYYAPAEDLKGGGSGGGSSFIPNGVKVITESRELQADDAGYMLLISRDSTEVPPVVLTIPDPSPLQAGESFAIINGADSIKDKDNGFRLGDTESPLCTPAITECVLFTTVNVEDANATFIVSSVIVGDGNEGNLKTALRHLMDNQGNLFPNGIEIVSSTRDFQASDVGKYLVLLDGVGLTMPVSAPFIEKNKLIGVFAATTNFPCDNYFERMPGEKVYMYSAGHSAQTSNEAIILVSGANFDDTQQTAAPANDAPIFINENDTVGYTSKRYLMDNSGNTGTATLVAGTVTVADARVKTGAKIIVSVNTPGGTQGFLSAPSGSIVDKISFVINSSSNTETSTVNYWFVNP